jgi:PAS domain S-box-containing protein
MAVKEDGEGRKSSNNGRLSSLEAELSRCREIAEDFELDARRYRKYLDIALCIMVIIDKNGDIEFINKHGAILLGYLEVDELIGENWFEKCCPPKIRGSLRFIHGKLIEGEVEPFSEMENSILTRFGTEKTIRWKNSFIKNEEGNIVSTVSIGTDVSKEREQEKEMERLEM